MKHERRFDMFIGRDPRLLIALVSVFVSLLCFSPVLEAADNDTLTTSDSLTFNRTLISSGGNFEFGFFELGSPRRYYLGIWYRDIPTRDIIWVANRDSPAFNNLSTLVLGNDGNLMIRVNGSLSNVLWSSSNQSAATNPVLQLLDSGNLVVREAADQDPNRYYWQSFDDPTDTLIPGQRMEFNNRLGIGRASTCWKAPDDPGSGNFSFAAGPNGRVHLYLTRERSQIIYKTPVVQEWTSDPLVDGVDVSFFNYTYTYSTDEVNYVLQQPGPPNAGVKLRVTVTYDGRVQEWMWNAYPNTTRWNLLWTTGDCECGPYGVCSTNGKVCECPKGFEPTNSESWRSGNWSAGCARINRLECGSDRFLNLEHVKVLQQIPTASFVNDSMDLEQCRNMCAQDCNCMAYASSQVINQGAASTGCVSWTGNLTKIRNFTEGGQTLYVRLAASDLASGTNSTHSRIVLAIVIPAGTILVMLLAVGIWFYTRKGRKGANLEMNEIKSVDSLQFDLNTIRAATRNFSLDNKLGEGGFGEVYKGMFEDGQEIAVKRLSKGSTQGALEFKTEILLVAKLQHKNLVKLLGFCLASKEKILIYEYLRNSSLDRFLFDSTKKLSLNWQSRFKIVVGIARGLMYLHVDSRLKVIHRDLKTSNILLDENMNPKIADFGLAKLFGIDQTQDNTKRIVGTYGYMAPEYAMTGHFSVKSDVYSFGVILLEIVSGQRSKFTISQEVTEALLHRAWRLWNEGNHLDLVDKTLGNDYPKEEITKCILIGLLCIQENATERPTMEIVVATLSGEAISLPKPKAPHFFGNITTNSDISYSMSDKITITEMDPR